MRKLTYEEVKKRIEQEGYKLLDAHKDDGCRYYDLRKDQLCA